jgi:hypothetical protein
MTTSALVEQRMDALLASRQYEKACAFAADSIAANRGNQERMGPKLRNEVDRLRDKQQFDEALRLIDAIKSMNPKLENPSKGQIDAMEQAIRQRQPATPRSAGGAGGTVGETAVAGQP